VPPGDPDALANALALALAAPPSESPRDFVERAYDWERTLAAYRRLTGDVDDR
jgi:glycosyltransferase involved in cell wall biosynthesis